MDKAQYQSILNKLEKQDTAIPSTYDNIPIGNFTNTRPTDLENFYTQNRIRQADNVNSIYNDPQYASTILNSSIPLNQLEKNIEQSKGATLEPYNKSITDYLKQGASYVGEKVGLNNYQANKFGRQMFGDRGSDQFSKNIGFMDIVPAFKGMHMASIPMIPAYLNEAYRAFDRGDNVGGAIEGTAALAEGVFLGKPIAQSLKALSKSLSDKIKGDPSKKMSELASEIQKNQKNLGALPSNKVMANTKLQAPSMVMTDPKVVDEFGFYSEAERQAKMMQQNKGSGAQFAGFLLNKGVKQDELDAIGLTDLFKNDNVTKKEIIDTIELNKVQLIETKKTGKSFTDPNDPYLDDFDPETFTNIRNGEEGFKTADEVKEAHETGRYSQPTIEYDAKIRTYANSDETESMKLYGSINTHMPTQYKILELENLSDEGQDISDIYLTFRPNADVKDWRNSVEASTFADEKGFDVKDLDLDDFAEIIQDRTAQTFAEATVRLRGATIAYGDYDPGSLAKWEGSTQDGGTNYKELLLRLPPKGYNRYGKNDDLANPKIYDKPKDFQYRTHFDEFNPLFHIRTKDRVTTDGKKVLYVEELQSDWAQKGSATGFKLEGEKLAAAKKELADVSKELTDLKKGGVKLDGYEQEALYKLAYPNRPPIRIPFIKPKDFQAKHDSPSKYYDTDANVKDYDFDYSQSRMPKEFKTMTFGQYMNFYETMGRIRKGELNERSIQLPAYRDSILNPQDAINKYYDDKDADFLFGQINQPSFNADGNKFMKDLSKKYLKKYNAIQGGVPNAPFVTDRNKWTGLAIKRLIKLAEEGGYDHIAFSPGKVQYERWGDRYPFLIDYYDKIIPQVASKLPKSLGVTTEKITVPIKPEVDVGVAVTYDGKYFVRNDGSDKAIEGKLFNNEQDAFDYADMIRSSRTNQETFAINITPKMKETVRGGMPLFSTVGGMVGLGALGSMPSTQDGGT